MLRAKIERLKVRFIDLLNETFAEFEGLVEEEKASAEAAHVYAKECEDEASGFLTQSNALHAKVKELEAVIEDQRAIWSKRVDRLEAEVRAK